ncbi:hypothetical protein Tco_1258816, partial [Tanacetum coccineum]
FLIKFLVKILGQTRSSVGVNEKTRESLRDIIALLMREELEKLRDEMRKCSKEFFKVNNIPDESKVKFISTHWYDIALKWHKQFLGIMRGQVDWVLYKESILLRFGQNKKFMSDNVKDSSCGLHVIDKVGDLLSQTRYSDAYVRESIEVGNRIVEDVVVETAKVDVEVGNEIDGFVTDMNRSKLRPHKNNGSFVHRIKDFHLFGMYVGTRYIEGWEDEDKYLNVFDYDCEVYDLSRKALLGAKEFFIKKKQEEDFDKIKRDIKHESVKELVDESNGLVEDKLLASNCCSFSQGYVYKANTNCKFIFKAEQVFDPGGKWVCDLGGSSGRNVSGKQGIETNLNICKHGMGGNEPVLNDIFVDIVDKLTDKGFKISTFMETQVGYLCIRLWLGLYGYQICLKTFSLEKVLEYSKRIREPVRYEVRKDMEHVLPTKKRIRDLDVLSTRVKELMKNAKETRSKWSSPLSMEIRGGEVTKFGLKKEKVFEILESEFVMELMLITNMCDKPFESMSRSCECCYSQWSYVVVIKFVWKGDSWPMKSGVNCIVIVSVQGVSRLNHLDSCQSMVEEEELEADIEVPEQVDTKVPGPVLEIVDNELVPEIVSKLLDTKADIEVKLGSESHMTSFSDLGFSDSYFSNLSFSDLSFSHLSESHTEVGIQLARNKTISGNSSGLGHLKSVRGKLSCCIHVILEDKNILKGKALIWIN